MLRGFLPTVWQVLRLIEEDKAELTARQIETIGWETEIRRPSLRVQTQG